MTGRAVRSTWGLAAAAAALLLGGCPPRVQPLPAPMTLQQVVEQVNRNNALLPWFKARFDTMAVTVYDDNAWPYRIDTFGYLIYAQPDHLYMNAFIGGETIMGLGGNERRFWLWIRPVFNRCWVGSDADWDPTRPGAMPINPRHLARLLGVDAIPPDLARTPWVVLRTSEPAERANIVQFIQPPRRGPPGNDAASAGAAAPLLTRELWIDRDSNLPRRVVLFDRFGQPVIESTLSDWRMATSGSAGWFPFRVDIRSIRHKPVEYGRPPRAGVVETTVSRLRLTFVEVEVDEKFDPEIAGPLYDFRYPPDLMLVPIDEPPDWQDEPPGE